MSPHTFDGTAKGPWPYQSVQATKSHFGADLWCSSLLSSSEYDVIETWARNLENPLRGLKQNGLFGSTLNSEITIPYALNLRKKTRITPAVQPPPDMLRGSSWSSSSQSEVTGDGVTQPDLIMIVQLGGAGICGHLDTAHGGVVGVLFDEVLGATAALSFSPGWELGRLPTPLFTIQLQITFLEAIHVPGKIVLKSWCVGRSGRKSWARAELLQEVEMREQIFDKKTGDQRQVVVKRQVVKAKAESFWLQPRQGKM